MARSRILGFPLLYVAAAAFAAPDSWAQSVWVVDNSGGPGSNFTDLQPAINAASNGDIIIVRFGFYSNFTIDGKGLVLISDAGATPLVGAGTIANTQSWQSVVIRGHMSSREITAHDLAGPLWIEDLNIFPGYANAVAGVRLTNCASVAIRGANVQGGANIVFPAAGGAAALNANNSNVAVYDSTITGGEGAGVTSTPYPGGPGATLAGGSLYAARCLFHGGKGGNGPSDGNPPPPGAPGGAGLITSATTQAASLNCQFQGGDGGTGIGGVGPTGTPLSTAGPYQSHTGPDFVYSLDSPVREQQSLALHFNCDIAVDAYVFVSAGPAPAASIPGIYGPLLVDLATLGYAGFGTLPPGPTTISIPVVDLPPTMQGAVLATQAIFIDPNFTFVEVGAPSHLVVLDASIH